MHILLKDSIVIQPDLHTTPLQPEQKYRRLYNNRLTVFVDINITHIYLPLDIEYPA